MADRVGQQIGHYRLQRLLGEGGFAEVYLGEHVHLRTLAAIKVLSTRLHSEEIERFREEAETLAHLKHPHIVKVFDFGVEGGVPFLVMDYAVYGTLRQRHPKGTRLAPATILPYVLQVASALQYAHERKLIHRDVKPENMLLSESDEVLLSDFGIAIVSQSSRYQSTQDIGGTIAYMAPEQIQGKPRPASDQYSLGIVIYEWLCGARPFHGAMNEVIAQHLATPPQPLRDKLPDLSPGLEQVVLTALEKDPKERFATIQAFTRAFEQACQTDSSFLSPSVRGLLPELSPLFVEPALPPSPPEEERVPPLPPEPPSLADEPAWESPHVSPPPQAPTAAAAVLPERVGQRYLFALLVGTLVGLFSVLLTNVIFNVIHTVNAYWDARVSFALLPPLILSLITGFLAGKRVVVPTAGLAAGLLVGVFWLVYALSMLVVHDFPPPAQFGGEEWGAVVACAPACGLLSWLGAWMRTHLHLYEQGSSNRNGER